MHADNAVFNESSQREPVEEGVDALPGPEALLVAHALYALQPEPEESIDVRRLHERHDRLHMPVCIPSKQGMISARAREAFQPEACSRAWPF